MPRAGLETYSFSTLVGYVLLLQLELMLNEASIRPRPATGGTLNHSLRSWCTTLELVRTHFAAAGGEDTPRLRGRSHFGEAKARENGAGGARDL